MAAPPPPPLVKGKLPVKRKPILTPENESLQNALSGIKRTNKAETKGIYYFAPKSPSGFVGLSNQGATCYLNSFLQSLFLSPEFFQLLFSYNPPPKDPEEKQKKDILLQLQRLFANLAFNDKKQVNTQDLTRSFGWNEQQLSSQQDVQELRIVFFEALEKCFSKGGTVQLRTVVGKNISISDLFGGTQEMYISCIECGYRSSRLETFRDIQLMVRDISGLEESLQLLLQPEEMMGENKYRCSGCEKLSDALRGTTFIKIPPVLTFQLHRFDFNYATMARVKINSRFTFPFSLNISKYYDCDSEDIYDLCAVMIHSGGANGGHYCAYIKETLSNRWFVFNDQDVKEIPEEHIEKSFGGSTADTRSSTPQGTAYMVVYRHKSFLDAHFDTEKPREDFIHSYLKKEVDVQNQKYQKEKDAFEERKSLIHLQFLYPTPGESEKSSKAHLISIPNYKTLNEATVLVRETLCKNISVDCIRLRGYDKITNKATTAFTNKKNEKIEKLLFSGQLLFVETKSPGETFQEIESDIMINISIVKWESSLQNFAPEPQKLSIPPNTTVIELKQELSSLYDIVVSEVRLFQLNTETLKVTEHRDNNFPLTHSMTLYCEQNSLSKPSLIEAKFESDQYTIDIRFNLIGERLADQNISIDKRHTIRSLKEKISSRINVDVDKFLICNNMLAKKQFKELEKSLENLKIFDGSILYVCLGDPLLNGEYLLNCFLYPDDWRIIGRPAPASCLGKFKIHETMTPADLTELIMSQYGKEPKMDDVIADLKQKLASDNFCVRWREKIGNRAGRVILPSDSLLNTFKESLHDNLELIIQILNSPHDPMTSRDQFLLNAIRWNSSTWSPDKEKHEILVSRNFNIRDVKEYLSEKFKIETESVQIVKSPPKLNEIAVNCPISIAVLNWNTPEHICLTKSPWYLKDGDTILFRDSQEDEKEEIDPSLRAALLADGIEESIYIRTEYD